MQEVVDELVKGLTQEDLKGKLVVILAGYEVRRTVEVAAGGRLHCLFHPSFHH